MMIPGSDRPHGFIQADRRVPDIKIPSILFRQKTGTSGSGNIQMNSLASEFFYSIFDSPDCVWR